LPYSKVSHAEIGEDGSAIFAAVLADAASTGRSLTWTILFAWESCSFREQILIARFCAKPIESSTCQNGFARCRGCLGKCTTEELSMTDSSKSPHPFSRWTFGFACGAGAVLFVLLGVVIGRIGGYSGQEWHGDVIPKLQAYATHGADTFAMATGPVDEESEGLYILDYLTGDLHCWVMNPRTGKFGGAFKHNVWVDLGTPKTKNTKYVMVTGAAGFVRGGSTARPASSVLYVADTVTGVVAAYNLPWDRSASASGRSQSGGFLKLDMGQARNIVIRE
jgi:hypothetical protein